MPTNTTKIEYVGDLKFGPAEGEPVEARSTIEDWYEAAREEFILSRLILPILNGTDEDVERMVRRSVDGECDEFLTLAERCKFWKEQYEAGAEVMSAVEARLLIVCERVIGKEEIEKCYAEPCTAADD